jgi:hypothetical protein
VKTSGKNSKVKMHPEGGARKITMGSTYYCLHYHVVFSTKDRRLYIQNDWRTRLHDYLGGGVRGLGGVPEPDELKRILKKDGLNHNPNIYCEFGLMFASSLCHPAGVKRAFVARRFLRSTSGYYL